MKFKLTLLLLFGLTALHAASRTDPLRLSIAEYEDRVHAAWLGQIIGTLAGAQFEGKTASSPLVRVDEFPKPVRYARTDDDYYYELVALRAFRETDPKAVVRQAALLIHGSSPYRQCLDMVIAMAGQGAQADDILGADPRLEIEVAADSGRAWQLDVFANNTKLLDRRIEGSSLSGQREWQKIEVDLSEFRGQEVDLRLYQRTRGFELSGSAYWRTVRVRDATPPR